MKIHIIKTLQKKSELRPRYWRREIAMPRNYFPMQQMSVWQQISNRDRHSSCVASVPSIKENRFAGWKSPFSYNMMLIHVIKLKMKAFQKQTWLPPLHFYYICCVVFLLASVNCSSFNFSVISTLVVVGQEVGFRFSYHKAVRQKHVEQHCQAFHLS